MLRIGSAAEDSLDKLTQLLQAIRRDPGLTLDDEAVALLEGATERDLWAAKALMLHHARGRRFELTLPLLERIAATEATSESICNWAVGLRSLRRYGDAIAILRDKEALVDRIDYCDLMCSLSADSGDIEAAIAFGDQSLALKHEAAPSVPAAAPRIGAFDREAAGRNIISFSIWGSDQRYLQGAVSNAIVIRYLYPGWTARFYTDGSTPGGFAEALRSNGAEVILVEDRPAATHGLFWRFMVEDDADVDIFLVRDCDSVVNIKERWAVADWLSRGSAFHVMRDHPKHCELILAGMWGGHRGNIGDMAQRVEAFLTTVPPSGNYKTVDQHFTRRVLWPLVQNSVTVHDSWFNFGAPIRFSDDFALPRALHIGQNESARRR